MTNGTNLRDILKTLIPVFAGILIFQGTTYVPRVQSFIQENPYIVIIFAVILAVYGDNLVDKLLK
jgi:hypothetical protein